MTSPVYTVFAQQFLPAEMWVPFFNFMQFLSGVSVFGPPVIHVAAADLSVQTYFNTKLKKMRVEAEEKAKKDKEGKTN